MACFFFITVTLSGILFYLIYETFEYEIGMGNFLWMKIN
jgi:hypothetical protein